MKRAWILALLGLMGSGAAEAGAVRYEVEGKPFEGYYLAGADKDAPLVVLVHDWDGLNGYEIKRAEMLVALGYSVFAVDLFGAGVRPSTVEDKKRLTGALYQDRTRMRTLLQGGLAEAGRQGGRLDNAVALGYCFGGAVVLNAARQGVPLAGVVSFHGALATKTPAEPGKVKAKILVEHGALDSMVTAQNVAAFKSEMDKAGADYTFVSLEGAKHGFSNPDADRLGHGDHGGPDIGYNKAADDKSWADMQAFFKKLFG